MGAIMMKNYYWFRSNYDGEIVSASSLEAITELATQEEGDVEIYYGDKLVRSVEEW